MCQVSLHKEGEEYNLLISRPCKNKNGCIPQANPKGLSYLLSPSLLTIVRSISPKKASEVGLYMVGAAGKGANRHSWMDQRFGSRPACLVSKSSLGTRLNSTHKLRNGMAAGYVRTHARPATTSKATQTLQVEASRSSNYTCERQLVVGYLKAP